MGHLKTRFFSALLGVTIIARFGFIGSASASDPLAGEAYAPPPNVTLFELYDIYHNDNVYGGQLGNPHGPDAHDTSIEANIIVPRILHSYDMDGFNTGFQVYVPYISYLGGQHVGINDLGTPAPGILPSYGPGRANLGATSGFAQPNIALYIFPIANRVTGTYLIFQPWISPPISSFNKNNSLNLNQQNVWTFTSEIGFRTLLMGTPTTPNLALEVWQETYLYGLNSNSALAEPSISANNIPAIYSIAHQIIPAIPDSNPVRAGSVTPAQFREQPTNEIRIYLDYEFNARIHAYIAPGFYQSFGGKQTYKLRDGTVVDSGARTNETQLRLVTGTFVTPSIELTLDADYDVAAHGTPYDRVIEFRFAKFFF
jgi:hypothetical protein